MTTRFPTAQKSLMILLFSAIFLVTCNVDTALSSGVVIAQSGVIIPGTATRSKGGYCIKMQNYTWLSLHSQGLCSEKEFQEDNGISDLYGSAYKYLSIPALGIELPVSKQADLLTGGESLSINVYPYSSQSRKSNPDIDFAFFFSPSVMGSRALSGNGFGSAYYNKKQTREQKKFIDPKRGLLLVHEKISLVSDNKVRHFISLISAGSGAELKIIEAQLAPDNLSDKAIENALRTIKSLKVHLTTSAEMDIARYQFQENNLPEIPQEWVEKTTDKLPIIFRLSPNSSIHEIEIKDHNFKYLKTPGIFEPELLSYHLLESGEKPPLTIFEDDGSAIEVITMKFQDGFDAFLEEFCQGRLFTYENSALAAHDDWKSVGCNNSMRIFLQKDNIAIYIQGHSTETISLYGLSSILNAKTNEDYFQNIFAEFWSYIMTALSRAFNWLVGTKH
jgi:hypothetical protein